MSHIMTTDELWTEDNECNGCKYFKHSVFFGEGAWECVESGGTAPAYDCFDSGGMIKVKDEEMV